MRIGEIRERAFAMPFTSPSYARGPYRFVNRLDRAHRRHAAPRGGPGARAPLACAGEKLISILAPSAAAQDSLTLTP